MTAAVHHTQRVNDTRLVAVVLFRFCIFPGT